MRHMVWRGLVAMMVVAGMSAPARADFNIATGLKWVPLRYTSAVGAAGGGGEGKSIDLKSWGSENSWQTTSLDPYIGFFFTDQIGLVIGLDLGWASHHDDFQTQAGIISNPGGEGRCANAQQPCDMSYFQFGFTLGGKFYLNRPTGQRVSPYLYVDFFKYFASVSTSDQVNPDRIGAIAALHSPLGFNLAFGAEYFFTTSFSLGAEVLGLRFAHVNGDYNVVNGGGAAIGHENFRYDYFTLYTGISINYRFLATASVRTYEDEEDRANPRPKRRPQRRPPPPSDDDGGNQPSPESVD